MSTTQIDFLKYRPLFYALSGLLFALFIGGAIYKYNTNGSVFMYNVDFTGGTQAIMGFSQKGSKGPDGKELPRKVSGEEVQRILSPKNAEGVTTREFSDHEILVRVKNVETDPKGLADRFREYLEAALPDTHVTILETNSVGSGVGGELKQNAVWFVTLSLILMLLYIWFRFRSFAFAMGAFVSLFHDAIAILTFVIWFDYEISLNILAAILFVLGYSIHDTIVVFSRIREHLFRHEQRTPDEVANLSINETLRRTLLTSFATALTVVALLIFGGEVLRTLSLALLIGIIFGTYSSIYIATPVMLLLYREKK
ncbi:TPA: protein translocase subunit SecF [Candidatus Dependentiae bacterium]|nr:MAG: Protein translocase subunit SecF [candidate division TM6 bacterium GW2011_GWF2_43_87]HBL98216.1 protein translocase subunit SecF [Candidatus Dependentiae bacterium]